MKELNFKKLSMNKKGIILWCIVIIILFIVAGLVAIWLAKIGNQNL